MFQGGDDEPAMTVFVCFHSVWFDGLSGTAMVVWWFGECVFFRWFGECVCSLSCCYLISTNGG